MNANTPTREADEKSNTTERVSWGRLLIAAFIMMVLPAVICIGLTLFLYS